ncbi:XdhC family protein [Methylomicrobium sp. Wu6]|uniref:XdhC family protein n=1 Tax=Methylomicrobium sp. Wu6 TaxID=3107928 RepID=UPI002DD672D2|nr:XdhC family protein [Methylomicrobium sp. Wu6]MEC4747264.1 XdhC family protein [Methylomicrobium sp. Wu6]
MTKNHHLLAAYREASLQTDLLVLATIIETFGSTYQKAGAKMLIAPDGELTGLLGGGCFELDLIEHARSVFETGNAKTVFYDMRSPADAIWGLGLGCNGAVRIFLQLLTAEGGFSPLNHIAAVDEAEGSGILVTVIESSHPDFPIARNLFLPDSTDRQAESFPAACDVKPASQQKTRLEALRIGDHLVKVFYDPLQPPSQLLVLGAGADAIPLVKCAKALGWRVTVADCRPGYVSKVRFPQADATLHLLPQTLENLPEWNRFSAAVLMTHNFDHDRRFLAALAGTCIPFIGLLGPAPRRERLLESLENAAEPLNGRVFGPVGLDIGAETPEEIALSIMAGIHAELKGRSGGQLSLRAAPLAA